jgi:hypothetical protein
MIDMKWKQANEQRLSKLAALIKKRDHINRVKENLEN